MSASQDHDPQPVPEQAPRNVGPVSPGDSVEVTVRVRPKAAVDPNELEAQAKLPPALRHYPTREEFAASHGADPADLAKVEAFARAQGLKVEGTHADLRTVVLSGPSEKVAAAFQTKLAHFETDQERFQAPTGPVSIPAELSGIVEAVVGLDNRTHARHHDSPTGEA